MVAPLLVKMIAQMDVFKRAKDPSAVLPERHVTVHARACVRRVRVLA